MAGYHQHLGYILIFDKWAAGAPASLCLQSSLRPGGPSDPSPAGATSGAAKSPSSGPLRAGGRASARSESAASGTTPWEYARYKWTMLKHYIPTARRVTSTGTQNGPEPMGLQHLGGPPRTPWSLWIPPPGAAVCNPDFLMMKRRRPPSVGGPCGWGPGQLSPGDSLGLPATRTLRW